MAVLLFAAWHTIKHGAPAAMRAVGKSRRASIDRWRSEHPSAPKSARWAAGLGYGVQALRHGPKHVKSEFAAAWREGKERGRAKFRPETFGPSGGGPDGREGGQVSDENVPVTEQRDAGGLTDEAMNARWEAEQRYRDDYARWDREEGGRPSQDRSSPPERPPWMPAGPAPHGYGAGNVTPINRRSSGGAGGTGSAGNGSGGADMPIQTATGGEITNAEQFLAESRAIANEAAADLEDASADSSRAQEDLSRIERMVASLSRQSAVANDIASVAGLKEPAAARAQAAKDRHGAAERRLAQAKAVVAIAAKHVQLIGQAAGPFYNPRG